MVHNQVERLHSANEGPARSSFTPSTGGLPADLRARLRRLLPAIYALLALGVLGALFVDARSSASSPVVVAVASSQPQDPEKGAQNYHGGGLLPSWFWPFGADTRPAAAEAAPLEKLVSFGRYGMGPGLFTDARGITVLQDRYLLVADTGNRRLQLLYMDMAQVLGGGEGRSEDDDARGEKDMLKYRTEYTGAGFVPWDVATIRDSYFVVTDTGAHRVLLLKLDHFGELNMAHAFTPSATELKTCGAFQAPRGVAVHEGTGLVVVAYGNAIAVLRLSVVDGKHPRLGFVGCLGTKEPSTLLGGFQRPMGVAILEDARQVFVVDSGNYRIQVLKMSKMGALTAVTSLGSYAKTAEDRGTALAFRLPPHGIAIHPSHATLVISEPESRCLHLIRWHNHPSQVRSRAILGAEGTIRTANSRLRGPYGLFLSAMLVVQCTGDQLTFSRWTRDGARGWLS